MARFNADGSPSGRPRYDDEGNDFLGTHEQVLASNEEVNKRYGLGAYANADLNTAAGGYGKKRIGEQSRGQMNLTKGRTSSILTSSN